MNLVSLEYFLANKTQNMDLNASISEKIETIFFAMTRCSLLYILQKEDPNIPESQNPGILNPNVNGTLLRASCVLNK